jgi:hypothetical protein
MSNGRRLHRDRPQASRIVAKQHPPDGKVRRFFWRLKKWMGIG